MRIDYDKQSGTFSFADLTYDETMRIVTSIVFTLDNGGKIPDCDKEREWVKVDDDTGKLYIDNLTRRQFDFILNCIMFKDESLRKK